MHRGSCYGSGGEAEGRREQVHREQQAAQSYPKGTEIMEEFYRYN